MTSLSATRADPRPGLGKAGLFVLLASEGFLFASLISAYLFLRVRHPEWALPRSTPFGLVVPALNTGLLILSGWTSGRAERALRSGDRWLTRRLLTTTLALGFTFIAGQIVDFRGARLAPDDMAFGGVFLMLMTFHGLHVVAGLLFHGWNLTRIRLGDRGEASVGLAALFWYFVVAVWIVLFIALYVV